MVVYKCDRCGYTTNHKHNFIKHINRKNVCKPNLSTIPIFNIRDNFKNLPDTNNELFDEPVFFKCSYCARIFKHRQSKYNHENKFCRGDKGQNTNLDIINAMNCQFEKLEKKHQDEKAILHKQIETLLDKVDSTTHQTVNIEQKVIINAYGKENLDYITNKYLKYLLQVPYTSIPTLIKAKHFHPKHPENHNVKITNKKLPYACVWNKNGWEFRNKKEVINDMIDISYSMIEDSYEEVDITKDKKKNYETFREKLINNDKTLYKDLEKQTELVIINESKQ